MELKISDQEFERFRRLIYERVGISLGSHKKTLVQGRLSKRIRKLKLSGFGEYYEMIARDPEGPELFFMIDAISTNVTYFFREPGQWAFLETHLGALLQKKKDKTLRIWSAACSSGEEPYSIAIFLRENIKDWKNWDIKILATDISQDILRKASKGEYPQKAVDNIPGHLLRQYFRPVTSEQSVEKMYQVDSSLRSMVLFRMFNLIHGNFSLFKKPFDIIFCRNVMIYFDQSSQKTLIGHFAKVLEKGSWLFVGHSESLTQNKEEFKLVKASVYERL